MRKLKTLEPSRQKELAQLFPNIIEQLYGEEDNKNYKWLSVSIFDHWLSKDEHNLITNVPESVHKKRQAILHSFTRSITDNTEVLTLRRKGKNKSKPVFKEFTSKAAANSYCEGSTELTGRFNLFVLILPEHECIIQESRDYTNHIYFRRESSVKDLLETARKCGLHTISELNKNEY